MTTLRRSLGDFASAKRVTISALKLLWLPVLELVLLRLALRYYDLRLGWKLVTDYDFIVPVPVAVWLFVFCLESHRPLRFQLSVPFVLLNLLSVSLFLASSYVCYWIPREPALMEAVWFTSLLLVLATAVGIVTPVNALASNPGFWTLIPSTIVAMSVLISGQLLDKAWPFLTPAAGRLTSLLLSKVESVRVFMSYIHEPRIVLKGPWFALSIGKNCSGISGVLLFWQSTLIFASVLGKYTRLRSWIFFLGIGTLLMFFLNAVRIAALFGIGSLISVRWGYSTSVDWVMMLFHVHLGWVLYLIGLISLYVGFWKLAKQPPRSLARPINAAASQDRPLLGLILLVGLSGMAWTSPVGAATCDQSCSTSSDCSLPCPVCTGMCVSCHELGTQTDCSDAATGADSLCFWNTSELRCTFIGEVPEMGNRANFGFLAGLVIFFALIASAWAKKKFSY